MPLRSYNIPACPLGAYSAYCGEMENRPPEAKHPFHCLGIGLMSKSYDNKIK